MKKNLGGISLILVVLLLSGGLAMALELKSKGFSNEEYIPQKYSGQGDDVSPQLSWSDVPEKTKSFAIICDDPDAPIGDWVHWIVYDIPADVTTLAEAVILPPAIKQGKNDFGNQNYGGPMPPPGKPHRYFFKIFALDTQLNLPAGLTKKDLLTEMQEHIIAKDEIIGLYKR